MADGIPKLRWSNGVLQIEDPDTGEWVDLDLTDPDVQMALLDVIGPDWQEVLSSMEGGGTKEAASTLMGPRPAWWNTKTMGPWPPVTTTKTYDQGANEGAGGYITKTTPNWKLYDEMKAVYGGGPTGERYPSEKAAKAAAPVGFRQVQDKESGWWTNYSPLEYAAYEATLAGKLPGEPLPGTVVPPSYAPPAGHEWDFNPSTQQWIATPVTPKAAPALVQKTFEDLVVDALEGGDWDKAQKLYSFSKQTPSPTFFDAITLATTVAESDADYEEILGLASMFLQQQGQQIPFAGTQLPPPQKVTAEQLMGTTPFPTPPAGKEAPYGPPGPPWAPIEEGGVTYYPQAMPTPQAAQGVKVPGGALGSPFTPLPTPAAKAGPFAALGSTAPPWFPQAEFDAFKKAQEEYRQAALAGQGVFITGPDGEVEWKPGKVVKEPFGGGVKVTDAITGAVSYVSQPLSPEQQAAYYSMGPSPAYNPLATTQVPGGVATPFKDYASYAAYTWGEQARELQKKKLKREQEARAAATLKFPRMTIVTR